MAIKTTRQQLEEVQAAIEKVLASQEMSSGSDRVVRARLDVLYKREDQLLQRLKAETGESRPGINTGLIRGQ